jgi:hypothetical protein
MLWENREVEEDICVFLQHMAALNSSILLKKHTTKKNQKGKGYASKDITLDCVEKITEPQERK